MNLTRYWTACLVNYESRSVENTAGCNIEVYKASDVQAILVEIRSALRDIALTAYGHENKIICLRRLDGIREQTERLLTTLQEIER